MRPASNGLATTLLLLVPLVAVPFAAAIGLPQLSATPAVSAGQPEVQPIHPAATTEGPANETDVAEQKSTPPASADDLFAPLGATADTPRETSYEEPVSADARTSDRRARVRSRLAALAAETSSKPTAASGAARPTAEPLADAAPVVRGDAFESDAVRVSDVSPGPDPRPLAGLGARSEDRQGENKAEPSSRQASTARGERRTDGQLTWERAIQRMKELGIEDFALSPGEAERGFHFHCQLSDADDPDVVHRFEAEAADPLTAVASAIEQVEGWLQQTAASNPELDDRLARLGRNLEPPTR
jgi:hypothetical protein